MPNITQTITQFTHVTLYQSNDQNSQTRLQQYVNRELPDVQADFRKVRGTRDLIANMRWIIKKARVPENYLLLLY